MNIRNLFTKPIDRFIEGVIKADDEEHLSTEMEEYIITRDLGAKLKKVIDDYSSKTEVNGVWISGFFGSGKSHLLKMLSYALVNRTLPNAQQGLGDIFKEKIRGNIGEMEASDFGNCLRIPSESLLFNIDQQADASTPDMESRVLAVFLKVFNRHCGYNPSQAWFADFERAMDQYGQLESLKERYKANTGKLWEADRPHMYTIRSDKFATAYADVTGKSKAEGLQVLPTYKEDFSRSIGDFANMVKTYIDQREPRFRLNFFVDEVGQFIADDTQRMLNLQTIVESLNTKCGGQAWIFVTSQANLEQVIGGNPGQDFSRIQDRFTCKISLEGNDVSEVIQLRLLQKKTEVQPQVGKVYEQEQDNLRTLFSFDGGTASFPNLQNADHFVKTYPFMPYQYDLFRRSLLGMSSHGSFTGQHQAVGQRSMLGVFQDVLKEVGDRPVPELATFDQMFAGIRQALRPEFLSSINFAESGLHHPMAIRVVKVLALVKYVDAFKATPRNLAILLIDQPQADIAALQSKVQAALEVLENQSYVQRSGNEYAYLTNEEKDVEERIKSVLIEPNELTRELGNLIYGNVLPRHQVAFEDNRQHYRFARKLDGTLAQGREEELAVNVISMLNENLGNEHILLSQSTGRSELLVILQDHPRLLKEVELYLKTDRYIRLQTNEQQPDSLRRILREKGGLNTTRKRELVATLKDLLQSAKLFVNNQEVGATGDAVNRVETGLQELIRATYPNLRMLRGVDHYQEDDLQQLLTDDLPSLFGNETEILTEAEQEILQVMSQRRVNGERTSVRNLEDIMGAKPYGWPRPVLLCLLARLFRKSRLETRKDNLLLEENSILQQLPNSAQGPNLILTPVAAADPAALKRLRSFHQNFFHQTNTGGDPRAVTRQFREAVAEKLNTLDTWLVRQQQYPFTEKFEEVTQHLQTVQAWNDEQLLNDLNTVEGDLLDLNEEVLDPLLTFLNGPQLREYDEIREFWNAQRPEVEALDDFDTRPIVQLLEAHVLGRQLQIAKSVMEDAKARLQEQIESERTKAVDEIKTLVEQARKVKDIRTLAPSEQEAVLQPLFELQQQVGSFNSAVTIRDRIAQAKPSTYIAVLDDAAQRAQQRPHPEKGPAGSGSGNERVHDPSPRRTVYRQSIEVSFSKPLLETEADVETYVSSLREQLLKQIRNHHNIAL
ncbi:MAG: hypothetical protein CL911_01040 [Deltaproteobacteria bacterium]|nr:hypothetical protein [Deltaproteobacteria bacterium]